MNAGKTVDTLDAIVGLSEEFGYPPTVRELADVLDLSISTTYDRLVALRADGLIRWDSKKFRTLVVV